MNSELEYLLNVGLYEASTGHRTRRRWKKIKLSLEQDKKTQKGE
jgi:hypothetical protein